MIVSILLLYAVIGFFGFRYLRKKKWNKEIVLYVLLLAISAYAAIAKRASLPQLSIAPPINYVFRPVEAWLETVMEGPFS
jgi:type II secretory pathway pseudopilin PulG